MRAPRPVRWRAGNAVTLTPEPMTIRSAPDPRAPRTEHRTAQRFRFDRCRNRDAEVLHLSSARRDRIGQDRGLSERHRCRAGTGPWRAAAGAGDRAYTCRGRAVLRALWRSRGDSAQRLQRFRARRSVAPNSCRRRERGGRHAVGRIRARTQSRADRCRRRARRQLQTGRDAAL